MESGICGAASTRQCTEKIAIDARYSVGSSLAIRDALRAGFGLSLIPYLYVEEDLRAGRLQCALEDWNTVDTTLYAERYEYATFQANDDPALKLAVYTPVA